MTNRLMLAVFWCLFVSWSVPAATYLEQKPLLDVVKTGVQNVRDGGDMPLPVITWGGDIATVLANGAVAAGNGASAPTTPGSIFGKEGLKFKLFREDVFAKQVEMYMKGETAYLRGTLGQINLAAEVLSADPRVKPVVIVQLTWSTGGDCLQVKSGINTATDLKGKTIVLQQYGPHVDYLTTVFADFGIKDAQVKWVKDITGSSESPDAAFRSDPSVQAAFVISPDAATLSGTGGEKSVAGSRTLLSTKTANRIIADVYAVRTDYFESHREQVEKFVHGLLKAAEETQAIFQNPDPKDPKFKNLAGAAGLILIDNKDDSETIKGLYGDCEFVGYVGNVKFFNNPNEPRRFEALVQDIQSAFANVGLLKSKPGLAAAQGSFTMRHCPVWPARISKGRSFSGILLHM